MDKVSHKGCGGTVLVGDMGGNAHRYCDVCRAFCPVGEQLPDGLDREANEAAWEAGELRSPGAQTVEGWEGWGYGGGMSKTHCTDRGESGTARYTLTCRLTGETQDVYVCPRHAEEMPLVDDDRVRAVPSPGAPCDFAESAK